MPALSREGWFLCRLSEWGVREGKDGSGSVAVVLKMLTRGEWSKPAGAEEGQWVETPECDVYGDFFVLKKDGGINQTAVDQLGAAGLIPEGGFMGYDAPVPAERDVVVQVGTDTYNGKTRYRANWVYPVNHTPGSGGIANRATRERLMELEARAGALLRASMKPVVPAKEVPF